MMANFNVNNILQLPRKKGEKAFKGSLKCRLKKKLFHVHFFFCLLAGQAWTRVITEHFQFASFCQWY